MSLSTLTITLPRLLHMFIYNDIHVLRHVTIYKLYQKFDGVSGLFVISCSHKYTIGLYSVSLSVRPFYWWRKLEYQEKTATCCNFITYKCTEYTSPWVGFELTTLAVIGTDSTGRCNSNYHSISTTTALSSLCVHVVRYVFQVVRYMFQIVRYVFQVANKSTI
jgi:hypothetical protein